MVPRYVPPAAGLASFSCPRCGALADQHRSELSMKNERGGQVYVDDDPTTDPWPEGQDDGAWYATKCFSCKRHCLWIGDIMAYPAPLLGSDMAIAKPSEDLPEDVLELYLEAAAVLPHSKRAAAALCRAALERLVKHLTTDLPENAKLHGRLLALRDRVSSSTIKALTIVRHTGNTALHGQQDDDQSAVIYLDENDESIAGVFFTAINALVDELITKPREVDELFQTLPEGVRRSVDADQG